MTASIPMVNPQGALPPAPADRLHAPAQPSSPEQNIPLYASIDMVRAIAIIMVVLTHSGHGIGSMPRLFSALFDYSQTGVQLFFVASAFTLCLSMDSRKEGTVKSFYLRRFFRIAPLYYAGILFYACWWPVADLLQQPHVSHDYTLTAVLENILFVHGLDPEAYNSIVPGGWSISTEMMFYLMFPLLFFIRKNSSDRTFLHLCIGIVLMSVAGQWIAYQLIVPSILGNEIHNDGYGFLYASLFNQLGVFLAGMLCFTYRNRRIGAGPVALACICIGLSVHLLINHGMDSGIDGALYPILAAAGFGVFFVLIFQSRNLSFAGAPMLTAIGRRSFSIYLVHFFILDIARAALRSWPETAMPTMKAFALFALTLFCSFWVAGITWRFIERPGIRLGNRLAARATGFR